VVTPATAALPPLREELELMAGPVLPDGQPSWTLHDPSRQSFFRVDWPTFEILTRWSMGRADVIVESVSTATTLQPGPEDVERVARFLTDNQLVQLVGRDAARKAATRWQAARRSALTWLLHHYLFFRLPLVKPDAFLDRWRGFADLFFTRAFAITTLFALVAGLFLVVRQVDVFFTSLIDTFSLKGLLGYGVALICVKTLHELGHAFTAKRYGCKIPAMGIAFIVLWPMAYTDTNEVWRLTDRWKRFMVSCAGIITELTVAIWATLAWALLPEGSLRGAAFMLATTSWVATLAINASPFMRFDGYFILSDALDMPNLHGRSFALARWKLREWLFDLGEDPPEYFSRAKRDRLIAFAWMTWIYRFVVFLGIAVLVYHFFFKLLGVFLFVVELAWFIALPVWKELKAWGERAGTIRRRPGSRRRALLTLLVASVLTAILVVPWSGRITTSAVLRPSEILRVYAPEAATLEQFTLKEGARVAAGTPLIVLDAPDVRSRAEVLQATSRRLRWEAETAGFADEARARLRVMQEELARVEAELATARRALAQFAPRAPFDGVIRDVAPDMRPGQWVAAREQLAVLVGDGPMIVETYLDEESVKRVAPGQTALFRTDGLAGPALSLRVARIDADATRVLPSGMLAAPAGGHVLIRESRGERVPELAVYRVVLEVESPGEALAGQSWRGRVVLHAEPESIAGRYLRQAASVLARELGF